MENNTQSSQLKCYKEWINLQEQDLTELLQAFNLTNTDNQGNTTHLTKLLEKNIKHFENYATQRAALAQKNTCTYFSPTWCTSLENSMLWVGGCRPSKFIRLIYSLCGNEFISHLGEYLTGIRTHSGLGSLSVSQIEEIDKLQMNTIREEEEISKKLAGLQEQIADFPIAIIAMEVKKIGEGSTKADQALDAHGASMLKVLGEADNLRLSTMKKVMEILSPVQCVEFLASGKKLHICLHEWGRMRDCDHGRN